MKKGLFLDKKTNLEYNIGNTAQIRDGTLACIKSVTPHKFHWQ